MQTEYTYEPFGQTTVIGLSNTNPFQYTGRENDGTNLYYYRARYYDPALQRFISEDPFNIATIQAEAPDEFCSVVTHEYVQDYFTSANLYLYVDNMPVVSADPLGLFCGAAVFGTTLGGQIAGNSALGVGLGAVGGVFGARKPLNGAGLGVATGKTIGALAALTPWGVPGAIVGGLTGAAMGAAVGGAAGGTAGSMMLGVLAGAVGGAASGAIGGHCGTIVGTAAGMALVIGFGGCKSQGVIVAEDFTINRLITLIIGCLIFGVVSALMLIRRDAEAQRLLEIDRLWGRIKEDERARLEKIKRNLVLGYSSFLTIFVVVLLVSIVRLCRKLGWI